MKDKNIQAKIHVVPLISVSAELKPGVGAPNQAGLQVGADQEELGDSLSPMNCAGNYQREQAFPFLIRVSMSWR